MTKRPLLALFLCSLSMTACGEASSTDTAPAQMSAAPEAPVTNESADSTDAPLAASEQTDTFELVMLGDSITAGFGLRDSRLLTDSLDAFLDVAGAPEVEILNAGVSGDRMQDAAGRFDWSVGPDADGVLIALGGNDLLRGVDPSVTRDALESMLAKATERDIWVGVAGLRAPGNASDEFASEFNGLFDELTAQYCVPLYPNFLLDVINEPSLNQADGIHPTPEGVAVLVSNLGPWLAEALDGKHDPC